jgi:hypothetical protein
MLSTNLPLMKQKFSSMLTDNTGMFYKAAYEAYLESMSDQKPIVSNDPDISAIIDDANAKMNKLKIEKSEAFAKAFVKSLRNSNFDDLLANEIDKHIKSMMLTITVPALLPTIISPAGPCSGSLTISEATGAKISIN